MKSSSKTIAQNFNPESSEAVELRRSYSKLASLPQNGRIKRLLVTSATIGEGKSTVSSLLAAVIAHSEKSQCILIDCDLRRPYLHTYFAVERVMGVTELIREQAAIQQCLKPTYIDSLKLITSGEPIDSPAEVLSRENIRNLLSNLHSFCDTVIIDSPPIIPVSDPIALGLETEGTLIVIKAGVTPKQVVKRAVNLLHGSGVNILGALVNNPENVLPYYYSPKYYGYKY